MPKLPKAEPPNRIAFYGPMASGKTWCANYLVNTNYYKKFAFADKLKALAYEMYGIQGKDGKGREVLQGLGNDLRKYDPDVWIKYLLYNVKAHISKRVPDVYVSGEYRIVVDDLRYINEAKALKRNDFLLVLVNTPKEIREQRIATLYPETARSSYYTLSQHPSEREWEQIQPDYVVESIDWGATSGIEKFLEQKFRGFQRV